MAKKFSKKLPFEEKKEFKKGKYMGGPAEEKAEKKKKKFGKRFAAGGPIGYGGTNINDPIGRGGGGGPANGGISGGVNAGGRGPGGPAGGITTGNVTGTSATNKPPGMNVRAQTPAGPKIPKPMRPARPRAGVPGPALARPLPSRDLSMSDWSGEPVDVPGMPGGYGVPGYGTNARPPGYERGMPNSTGSEGVYASGGVVRKMKGGGLARKGVGQALAKGGLVKGSGCAQRGVKKPRMK